MPIYKKPAICVIVGTRPEAIKLAPLVLGLRENKNIECQLCVTAQHRQMVDQALAVFGIQPDVDLDLMQAGQSLSGLTARLMEALGNHFERSNPDLVLVQGDTTTVFCATLAAFYHHIPVGHVEAGLRTGNMHSPWPEEANRVLTSRLARLHFTPTDASRRNLLNEGIPADTIFLTGNTVIDALLWVRDRIHSKPDFASQFIASLGIHEDFVHRFLPNENHRADRNHEDKLVLVTGHRRESFGQGFEDICQAIRQLVERHPNVGVLYPVHLNPNVQDPVRRILGEHPRIQLVKPLSYEPFIWLMEQSHFILTDSGGVQEEAPSLGKPVLVMRDTTERPEGIEAGTCRLVGSNPNTILREASLLIEGNEEYRKRSQLRNPYGDGTAAAQIIKHCERFLATNSVNQKK